MSTPAVYYVNLGFAWFLVLMSIWGYTTILRNTGQKMVFWLFFATHFDFTFWSFFSTHFDFTFWSFFTINFSVNYSLNFSFNSIC